ncbi:hypothetical protein HOS16_gp58 [Shigella phage vB_SflS-ISF001]|uniref:Uncharacterized protein n=1 Tax=Shigella phage vB_SflS-ISF001 TaxID=2048005 RepID=A0A2D1GQ13_9CAUD|nr:hypothetical protein HOS16_gp58 [Shigella phage vB_SflS-ISF001]ATN94136.1 hypothetical protein FLXISF001_058 [Shigella phage vB_SflS-ISF001]
MKIKLLCTGGYKGFTRDLEADPIVVDAVKCDSSTTGYRVKVDDLVFAGVYDLDYGLSVSHVFGPADKNENDGTMSFFEWEVQANPKPPKVRLLSNGGYPMRWEYENPTFPVIVDFERITSNLAYVNDEQLKAVGFIGGMNIEALCFFVWNGEPFDIECELVY